MPGLVAGAQDMLRRALADGDGRLIVGLSGGKDSLVTLDLACRAAGAEASERVLPFFMFLVRGLRCVEAGIEAAAARHRVRVVYFPHWILDRHLAGANLMPHPLWRAQRQSRAPLGINDIERAARAKIGAEAFIAYGHRMDESLPRRGMLKGRAGYLEKERRVYPLWNWSSKDVFAYLRARRIPLPVQLGKGDVSGVDLTLPAMSVLKEHYPDDYARVREVFPYVDALFVRAESIRAKAGEVEPSTKILS